MPTSIFGVLGWPIGHSASPAMMNAAFAEMGLDAYYGAFAVRPEKIHQALEGIPALGLRGVNVTIPHKQAVIPFVHRMSEAATLAGAVNTLRFHPETGEIEGHNTDIVGWWTSIKDAIESGHKTMTVIGAGGAARAIVAAMALYAPTFRLSLVARRPEQISDFATTLGDRISLTGVSWENRHDAIAQADVVVNTTPIGMWPGADDSPVEMESCLREGQVVQDIVYRPLQTKLLAQAERAGARTLDGLWMLVYQGAAAVEFWLDRRPPAETMRRAALSFLGASNA